MKGFDEARVVTTKILKGGNRRWEAKVKVADHGWVVGYGWSQKAAIKDLKAKLGVDKKAP